MDVRSNYCAVAIKFMITTSLSSEEEKIVAADPSMYTFDEQKMIDFLKD